MYAIWIILGDWGNALAAALYAAIAIATVRTRTPVPARAALIVALSLTALLALRTVFGTSVGLPLTSAGPLTETLRNIAWLAVVWIWLSEAGGKGGGNGVTRGAAPVLAALVLALSCQIVLDLLIGRAAQPTVETLPLFSASWILRAAVALGAVYLLHSLFARLARTGIGRVGWLGCALTVMWAYEFNHYLLTWLSDGRPLPVGQMRGVMLAAIAPMFLLGITGQAQRAPSLSHRATYRVALLIIGGAFAFVLFGLILVVHAVQDPAIRLVQLILIFALSVVALVLAPSAPFRAWLRVQIAKHMFTHRYDYRTAWIDFAEELADCSGASESQPLRAARAVARVFDAPATLLLLRDGDGALITAADWNWTAAGGTVGTIDSKQATPLTRDDWIVDLTRDDDPVARFLPLWLVRDSRGWALLPLVHGGTLLGAMVIARPRARGALDWEDIDMLRAVGRQLAVTLSERRHHQALAEAQRFDEFNRRFAFILHDIKNQVSQMSLLASNAERHAENPEFRKDMVLTLRETADRMTDLVMRLARPDRARDAAGGICDLGTLVRDVAHSASARGRVEVAGPERLPVGGDRDPLLQAINHLVQNGLEASPAGAPVRLELTSTEGKARLDIIDNGCGMSAEFIHSGLFRPFSSTKPTGFGLGAHEARTIIAAMGGRLDVTSREGAGTRFTISLPLAAQDAPAHGPAADTDISQRNIA